jgi:hypothetical protein
MKPAPITANRIMPALLFMNRKQIRAGRLRIRAQTGREISRNMLSEH